MTTAASNPGRFSRRDVLRRLAIGGSLAMALLTGCGRSPQLAPKNLRLAESLRTAISAKRTDWLEQNAKLFDERRKQGDLSDAEYQALHSILETARQGDWAGAQTQVLKLERAQRPPSS